MKRSRLCSAALASLLLVCALLDTSPAQALLIRNFSLTDLTREAHVVVLGQVVGSRSFYSDDHSVIYTHYTLDVQQSLKGLAPSLLEVRLMGGVVGDTELLISGNPYLQAGERVVLFLRDYGQFYTMVGMSQGKWSVRDIQGRPFAYRGTAPDQEGPLPGELPLDELLALCGLSATKEQP